MSDRRTGGQADSQPNRTEPSDRPPVRPSALVIQTAFLGDVVLTTPLLSVLADRHGPVDVVTTAAAASLLETHPAVRSVMRYDKHGADRGWGGFRRMVGQIRSRRYDTIYLPHRSIRSAALALLSGARERIGFADSPASLTYTRRERRPSGGHEVERLLALAGAGQASAPVTLSLTEADHEQAERWLATQGVKPGFVALAPGSIWATKRWPYYPDLAAALDRTMVIVGGTDDAELARAVIGAAPGRAASAAGALSLRASAALLQRAAVLVTNDSAPLHLATAVGTPVVAVFGPTVPEFGFGPRRRGDITLGHTGLACRPCSRHGPQRCPLGHHRCMRDLSVETVAAAVTAAASAEAPGAFCPRN